MEIKSIVSWNVNSIRKRADEIQVVIDKYDPTIICLQEIKANERETLNALRRYSSTYRYIYVNPTKQRAGQFGTCVMSKLEPIEYQQSLFEEEGRLQILDFGSLVLYNMYVQCTSDRVGNFDVQKFDIKKQFLSDLEKDILSRGEKDIIIAADTNTCLRQRDIDGGEQRKNLPGFTKKEREVMKQLMNETKLVDTFRHFQPNKKKYTFKGNGLFPRQRLDLFLVKEKMLQEQIKWSEVIYEKCFSGDHRIALLEFKKQNEEVDQIGQRLQLAL